MAQYIVPCFKRVLMAVIASSIVLLLLVGCGGKNPQTAVPGESNGEVASQDSTNDVDPSESTDGNSQQTNVKTVTLNLYFPKKDNSAVLHEKRDIQVEDGAIIKAAINALLEGPVDKNMRKGIPDGTKLLGAKVVDKVAILDFSKEFATANDVAEIVERISVINTITEIPGVEKVKILIEGKDWIAPSGKPYGESGYIKLNSQGGPIAYVTRTFTVYFGNSNADAVVGEKREVTFPEDKKLEQVVFEELAKGPKTNGLTAVIPQGTKLLSVETKNGVCYLNLSREFVDNSHTGTAGESMIINSIVNSLTELQGVNSVQFLIDGKKRDAFIHVVFDQPFKRNEGIIQK